MPSKLDPAFELFIDSLFDELVNMTAEYLIAGNGTDHNVNITLPHFSELIGLPINLNDFLRDYENFNGKFNSSLNYIDEAVIEKILSKQNQHITTVSSTSASEIVTSTAPISTTTTTTLIIHLIESTNTIDFENVTNSTTENTVSPSSTKMILTTASRNTNTTKKYFFTKTTITPKVQKQVPNNNVKISCMELDDGELIPDPTDCTSFYTCFKGRVIAKRKCNHNLYFDINLKVCNWPEEVSKKKIYCITLTNLIIFRYNAVQVKSK